MIGVVVVRREMFKNNDKLKNNSSIEMDSDR